MFDHLGMTFSDLCGATHFYTSALAPLGYGLRFEDTDCAGLGPQDGPTLWLYPDRGRTGQGVHIAFRAPDRAAVDAFHAAACAAGGRDNGGPGPRPDYGPTYYAAFVIDPFGNNVEAVCLG